MPGGYLHPERGPWEENQKFQRADEIPPLDLSNTQIWDKTPILDIWAPPSNPNPNPIRCKECYSKRMGGIAALQGAEDGAQGRR